MEAMVYVQDDFTDDFIIRYDEEEAVRLALKGAEIIRKNQDVFAVDYLIGAEEVSYGMGESLDENLEVDFAFLRCYGDMFVIKGYLKYTGSIFETEIIDAIPCKECGKEVPVDELSGVGMCPTCTEIWVKG